MEKPKISILSLSAKNKSSYFLYLFGQVKYRIKIFFYALTRQQFKKNSNIEKLAELNLTKCCKVLRHPAVFKQRAQKFQVFKSLIRGLTVLDVPFAFSGKQHSDTNIYIYIDLAR